jgi:hypothetical protein
MPVMATALRAQFAANKAEQDEERGSACNAPKDDGRNGTGGDRLGRSISGGVRGVAVVCLSRI